VQSNSGFTYNGIHYVSWLPDEYTNFGQPTGNATKAMDSLASTGATWVSVLVTCYQANMTSTVISCDPQKTPTDAALTYAIQQLHARGLKVMLKPHVDPIEAGWRGQFNPTDSSAWFDSYNVFITHYAQLAETLAVEAFVVGTEYKLLTGPSNQARWRTIINNVRGRYSGMLTYAANATEAEDEFTQVQFWDALDLIGLNVYFPLTDGDTPEVDELVSAWTDNANGDNLVQLVQDVHGANNKPVLFTEVGYRSITGANKQPWDWQSAGPYDPVEQANCYEAFLQVWSQQASWMQGGFWWDWPIPAPAPNDTGYTPQSKPASQVLANRFSASR
jgi:hypothetical protein